VTEDEDAEDVEIERHNYTINKIKEFTAKAKPYFCKDLKEALKENEKLLLNIKSL
jgi:hypothetical protein